MKAARLRMQILFFYQKAMIFVLVFYLNIKKYVNCTVKLRLTAAQAVRKFSEAGSCLELNSGLAFSELTGRVAYCVKVEDTMT